ncbi:ABC transporter ATP-binding protein [Streptomyces sp. NPDC001315]|uniref:ABC transporter ATP-binding protein n=1 Tax=Streptomyces sp. NPDC001315 TaxID=3364562 RepID=UPI0036BD1937
MSLMKSATRTVEKASRDTEADRPVLSVRDLRKHFVRSNGAKVPAVDGVSLDVRAGECLVLLGPSGCGKTTLLRSIAGLEHPDSGEILIEGRQVYSSEARVDRPPQQRSLSMVFQSYALWPNMSIFDNIAYPLRQRGVRRGELRDEVERICSVVGIGEVVSAYPNHISGGQQQRVALARALVSGDSLVLFDEPLSNVDAKVRKDLRVELTALQSKFGFAAVYVTHDQEEAMELGHRIAVLERGTVAQLADPRTLYSLPASHYVATFVGSANELQGQVESVTPEGAVISTPLGKVVAGRASVDVEAGSTAVAVFRPERARVVAEQPTGPNAWPVTYRSEMFSGNHAEHVVTRDHVIYRVWSDGVSAPPAPGSEAWMCVDPADVHAFRPRSDANG